jgi:hypothetical protein
VVVELVVAEMVEHGGDGFARNLRGGGRFIGQGVELSEDLLLPLRGRDVGG